MIKKIVHIILFLPFLIIGQTTNDWINYDQNYFKFPIADDGIYRIGFQELVNAGINITILDPENIQIFAKGREIPIYIQGDSDGSFDPNDFIEFYGEKNTGWYDHVLFSDSSHVLNPYVSMYSDTLYHYLTWNTSTGNLRMQNEVDLNFNAFTPSKFFWDEILYTSKSIFHDGVKTPVGWSVPEYSEGEGRYMKYVFASRQAQYPWPVEPLNTSNVYKSAPDDGWVKVKLVGLTAYEHLIHVKLNDSLIYNDTKSNYASVTVDKQVPSEFWEDQTDVLVKHVSTKLNYNNKLGIAYVHLRYPKIYNLNGESDAMMYIPPGSESKDLLVIQNFNNLNSTVRLYDLTNGHRVQAQPLSGKLYALIPNKGNERKCYLTTESEIKNVSNIVSVTQGSSKFINYQDAIIKKGGIDYLLITGNKLLIPANEYVEYRESKGLKSMVFDMDQLYDQFSFGIRKHPMSIRSLTDAIINHWGFSPVYLFLCGKSMTANFTNVRFGEQFEENIVPTWSVLGSDIGFTSGLNSETILEPTLATGRLAVKNEEEFRSYLQKVKDYESASAKDWMKQVLHFGGGNSESEQKSYKQYLEDFESLIEDSLFGANVHTFLKNSSDPMQMSLTDSVESLINNGVSLMTFFGHAYGQNFDQNIDEPETYSNIGKYPFILANSCLIGNIHTNASNSGSEKFVLSKDKGAIGFLGSSSLGVPSYLYKYSRGFYQNLSKEYYGFSVGEIVQKTISKIQDSSNVLNRDVSMYMTLHCDPAIVLNSHKKPDYTVFSNSSLSQPNVFFNPRKVSTKLDSFEIDIIIKNIGKSYGSKSNLIVTRSFQSQGVPDTTYSIVLAGLVYSDTVTINLPVDKINGMGLNKFHIRADALSEIDELNEVNNNTEISLFISSSDVLPVFPFDFAIVPNSSNVLKASTGDPNASLSKYTFQIDTSNTFDSPSLKEEIIESTGGVVEWNPSSSDKLSQFYSDFNASNDLYRPKVFFWRVSSDSTGNDGFSWRESSFQYVKNKTGWGQSHFHQFKKNEFYFIDYKYQERTTDFIKQEKTLKATTHLNAGLSYRLNTKYEIDGTIQCVESSHWGRMFFVAVIDKNTLKPWHTKDHGDYGHINFQDNKIIEGWNEYNFYFSNETASGIDSLMSFVKDVPDSNYVLLYSFRANNCSYWLSGKSISPDYEEMYQKIGANVDSLKNYPGNYPYILFFKKGDTSSVKESFSPDGKDYINLTAKMKNYWFNGTSKSKVIGPSSKWQSFHWDLRSREPETTFDTSNIRIYGIDYNGNESLLMDGLSGTGDMFSLHDSIDASSYPYLKLESFFSDDLNRTPDDLLRWQVTFDEMPEAAINPIRLYGYKQVDSVQQGESLELIIAIENISNTLMDSIQVSYRIIDNNFNNFPFKYSIEAPLSPGEVILDTINIPTSTLVSVNNLWYEINPFVGPRPWQLEQYHFNNLFTHEFNVYRDKTNPVLDITFDGIHILDGDIVSPNSNIVITLDDENKYLIMDDESLIQVFINYPNSTNQDSLVLIDPNDYKFTKASLPKNKCTIEYQANFKTDGVYELRLMANDKSNNISGDGDRAYDQRISFEVLMESSITQLINYPNPFSTSTRFVFTLTGSEIPDNVFIQIMTITGKVVKEITQDELGLINIGRNVTEYEWDGTDKYGDKLANGVYLYKVQVRHNGADLKQRKVSISTSEGSSTLANKYFKNGLGKMYILR